MKSSFEFSLALRYLKMRRHGFFALLTTLIAIGGVTLGVASLIITLAVMSGFREDIQNKTLGIQPHIILTGMERDTQMTLDGLSDMIKTVKGVESVAPFIFGQILLKSNRTSQGILLRGILPEDEFNVTRVKKTLISGDWEHIAPYNVSEKYMILGKELARNLGVAYGDYVIAFSPTETASLGAMGSVPKMEKYKVGGIFQSGYYEFDSNMAFTSLSHAKTLFGITGVTGFGIKTIDLNKASQVAVSVGAAAGTKYWARSWQELNRNLFEALKLEKIVMTIILTMIILVACFTIISNLILMTIEKSKEIGILKALGASQASIKKIFLYAGTILGTTGIFLGTLLGVLIVKVLEKTQWIKLPQDVYYIDQLPLKLSLFDISMVLISAFLITVLSAIYPASQAAKINPIDAIRYG